LFLLLQLQLLLLALIVDEKLGAKSASSTSSFVLPGRLN